MDRRLAQRPRVCVFLHICPHGDDSTEVVVMKGWWAGPGIGGKSVELHRFCIPNDDGPQAERIARGLEAAAAAVRAAGR